MSLEYQYLGTALFCFFERAQRAVNFFEPEASEIASLGLETVSEAFVAGYRTSLINHSISLPDE